MHPPNPSTHNVHVYLCNPQMDRTIANPFRTLCTLSLSLSFVFPSPLFPTCILAPKDRSIFFLCPPEVAVPTCILFASKGNPVVEARDNAFYESGRRISDWATPPSTLGAPDTPTFQFTPPSPRGGLFAGSPLLFSTPRTVLTGDNHVYVRTETFKSQKSAFPAYVRRIQ